MRKSQRLVVEEETQKKKVTRGDLCGNHSAWSLQAESFPLAPRAPSRLVRPGEGERGVVCRHPALTVATLLARGLSCLEQSAKKIIIFTCRKEWPHV